MGDTPRDIPDAVDTVGSVVTPDDMHPKVAVSRGQIRNADISIDEDAFARRMQCLIADAGLPPKRARFRTLDEMTSLTREEMGKLFGVAKGTMDATASTVATDSQERTLGHYALFDHPMNFIAMAKFRAESPADYIERVYFYELSYGETEPREPGPAPPRYQYCVIREGMGPDDRIGYAVSTIDIDRYVTVDDAIDALYGTEYFWSVERAEEWKSLLEFVYDEDIPVPPENRVNPDV